MTTHLVCVHHGGGGEPQPSGRGVLLLGRPPASEANRAGTKLLAAWALMALLLGAPCVALGQGVESLDDVSFRKALRDRGMTELYAKFIELHPPRDPVQRLVLTYETALAEARDTRKPAETRRDRLEAAVKTLRALIAEHPDHEDNLGWRIQLADVLLFQVAVEPAFAVELLEGGARHRAELAAAADEAAALVDQTRAQAQAKKQEMDGYTGQDWEEKYQRTGVWRRVTNALAQLDYLAGWAAYYQAVALGDDAGKRAALLQKAIGLLAPWTTPEASAALRERAALVVGKCLRAAGKPDEARHVLGPLTAVTLPLVIQFQARCELVKVSRDHGELAGAQQEITQLTPWLERSFQGRPELGLYQVAAATLHASVISAAADRAAKAGNQQEAARLLAVRNEPLRELAVKHPELRALIFEQVAARAERGGQSVGMSSFELASVGHERLREQHYDEATRVLQELIERRKDDVAARLRPDAVRDLALAYHGLGQPLASAAAFLRLAREWPDRSDAQASAENALRILSEAHRKRPDGETTAAYRRGLEFVLEKMPDSAVARRWRFHYGLLLRDLRQFAAAARAFAAVPEGDELYPDARYYAAASLGDAAQDKAAAETAVRALQAAAAQIEGAGEQERQPARVAELRTFAADLIVRAARLMLNPIGDAQAALRLLADFETRHEHNEELVGQALQLRIQAYQALKQTERATQTLHGFVERFPDRAGPVISSVLASMKEDIAALRDRGRVEQVRQKAAGAVELAQQLLDWAQSRPDQADNLYYYKQGLAWLLLDAGKPERAYVIFESLAGHNEQDAANLAGMACALFDQEEYANSYPLWLKVYNGVPEDSPLWWQALLHLCRCDLAMQRDPALVAKRVRQWRFKYPKLGGPRYAQQFQTLLQSHSGN